MIVKTFAGEEFVKTFAGERVCKIFCRLKVSACRSYASAALID